MKRLAAATAMVAALTGTANAAKGWDCVEEKSAGIHYYEDDKTWSTAPFLADAKFFVEPVAENNETIKWLVGRIGDVLVASCGPSAPSGLIVCQAADRHFMLDTKSLKFQFYYFGSYLFHSNNLQPSDAFVSIGRCSPR